MNWQLSVQKVTTKVVSRLIDVLIDKLSGNQFINRCMFWFQVFIKHESKASAGFSFSHVMATLNYLNFTVSDRKNTHFEDVTLIHRLT